ncbi:MAG: hypothetical protein LBB48_04010 [Treponema sp.]|jgi:hypothetical protein|nr:hypothetical protein [Treponema sp.]
MAREKTFNMEGEFAGPDFHSLRLGERFIRTMRTFPSGHQFGKPAKSGPRLKIIRDGRNGIPSMCRPE